jgi:hypothetical protein
LAKFHTLFYTNQAKSCVFLYIWSSVQAFFVLLGNGFKGDKSWDDVAEQGMSSLKPIKEGVSAF